MPSIPQLLIVLAIVVLVFGAKRLKNLGGDLGSSVKGFKDAVKDDSSESDETGTPDKIENTAERVATEVEKEKKEV